MLDLTQTLKRWRWFKVCTNIDGIFKFSPIFPLSNFGLLLFCCVWTLLRTNCLAFSIKSHKVVKVRLHYDGNGNFLCLSLTPVWTPPSVAMVPILPWSPPSQLGAEPIAWRHWMTKKMDLFIVVAAAVWTSLKDHSRRVKTQAKAQFSLMCEFFLCSLCLFFAHFSFAFRRCERAL